MTLTLTPEEQQAIQSARDAGVSASELVDRATADLERENGADKPAGTSKPITEADVDRKMAQADAKRNAESAKQYQRDRILNHISDRVASKPGFKGRDRKIANLREEVKSRVSQVPELMKATSDEEFYAGLDKLVDTVVGEEIADIKAMTGQAADAKLQESLEGQRDASVPGSSSGSRSADPKAGGNLSPKSGFDYDNPVFGLGVEQPAGWELEQAKARDLKEFSKANNISVDALG